VSLTFDAATYFHLGVVAMATHCAIPTLGRSLLSDDMPVMLCSWTRRIPRRDLVSDLCHVENLARFRALPRRALPVRVRRSHPKDGKMGGKTWVLLLAYTET
jgi:hypothetical protein